MSRAETGAGSQGRGPSGRAPRVGRGQQLGTVLVVLVGLAVLVGCLRTFLYAVRYDQALQAGAAPNPDAESQLQAAVYWRPDLADAWRELADRLAPDQPEQALQAAQVALRLDGSDWRNWDSAGMVLLQLNRLAEAHAAMAHAVANNQGFEARYTLGNLELIEGQTAAAREQLEAALRAATPAGVQNVVHSLLLLDTPATQIVENLQQSTPPVQARAVMALVAAQELDPASHLLAQMRCSPTTREECQWAVQSLISALVPAGRKLSVAEGRTRGRAALAAWNQAVRQGVLPGEEPTAAGHVVNGNFTAPWSNAPLNWVAGGCVDTGEDRATLDGRPGLFFQFDGSQPDACMLARQAVVVEPGHAYRLVFDSIMAGTQAGAGLWARVEAGGAVVWQMPAQLESSWQGNQGEFTVPADTTWVDLGFAYQRPVGVVSLRTAAGIAGVRLEAVGDDH